MRTFHYLKIDFKTLLDLPLKLDFFLGSASSGFVPGDSASENDGISGVFVLFRLDISFSTWTPFKLSPLAGSLSLSILY